jgi:hypothetical protein
MKLVQYVTKTENRIDSHDITTIAKLGHVNIVKLLGVTQTCTVHIGSQAGLSCNSDGIMVETRGMLTTRQRHLRTRSAALRHAPSFLA